MNWNVWEDFQICISVPIRDNNGNKVTQLFCVILASHLKENFFATIFNFNEFIFVNVVNIRFICDGEIYLLTYLRIH